MTHPVSPPQPLIFAPADSKPQDAQAAQYTLSQLTRADLNPSPLTQFHAWFDAAQRHPVPLPEATTLSTAELPSGRVSARMVYLKTLDTRGFVVFSNWGTSRKAQDIRTNPRASLVFWWREMERQVRVEGPTERLTTEEDQRYFDTRVRGSRIGAWASEQSKVLAPSEEGDDDGRTVLEARVADAEQTWHGRNHISVPPFWGGMRIVPETVEFWQGRESRLHDRFRYSRVEQKEADVEGEWRVERLSP